MKLILMFAVISHTLAGKKKCGVQVVAIEQIKYKPVPVEIVEKGDEHMPITQTRSFQMPDMDLEDEMPKVCLSMFYNLVR